MVLIVSVSGHCLYISFSLFCHAVVHLKVMSLHICLTVVMAILRKEINLKNSYCLTNILSRSLIAKIMKNNIYVHHKNNHDFI